MKSTLILCLFCFFISINTAYSQVHDTVRRGLTDLISCQATFKIAAAYIDIYQTFKEDLEKTELATNAQSIKEKLKSDWTRAEALTEKILQVIAQSNSIVTEQHIAFYNLEQTKLLQKIIQTVPAKEQIQALFQKSAQCIKTIDELEKLIKN